MKLADRTSRIASSPTMKVTATVDRLRRSGIEVIDFGAGEPDFSTPEPVKDAGHAALDANFTLYKPVPGIAAWNVECHRIDVPVALGVRSTSAR